LSSTPCPCTPRRLAAGDFIEVVLLEGRLRRCAPGHVHLLPRSHRGFARHVAVSVLKSVEAMIRLPRLFFTFAMAATSSSVLGWFHRGFPPWSPETRRIRGVGRTGGVSSELTLGCRPLRPLFVLSPGSMYKGTSRGRQGSRSISPRRVSVLGCAGGHAAQLEGPGVCRGLRRLLGSDEGRLDGRGPPAGAATLQ